MAIHINVVETGEGVFALAINATKSYSKDGDEHTKEVFPLTKHGGVPADAVTCLRKALEHGVIHRVALIPGEAKPTPLDQMPDMNGDPDEGYDL